MVYKHDYDTILTRLVTILSRLNHGEALSVKELAKEFNVSERTIQRDLNERLISFPIYQEKRKWKMQEGYALEKSHSVEEIVLLDIMEKLIEGAGKQFALKANALLSKMKNKTYNPIYAKLHMEDIGSKLKEVQILENAIISRRQIECSYKQKKRLLNPMKIVNYEGFWYLLAVDDTSILKKFYLKELNELKVKNKTFDQDLLLDRRLENTISIWFSVTQKPYRVTLQIDHSIVKYFKRKPISNTQRVESFDEDGSMYISVEVTTDMEIISLVKYWIPYIKVVKPKRIQSYIEEDIRAYIQ